MVELIAYVRTRPNATELLTSWVPKPGGPEAFCLGLAVGANAGTSNSKTLAHALVSLAQAVVGRL